MPCRTLALLQYNRAPENLCVTMHLVNLFTPLPSREGLGEGGDARWS